LLWFADALPRVAGRTAEEEIHRIRIQQTLDAAPRLLRVAAESNGILAGAFSPDGRLFATASRAGDLTAWDLVSGKRTLSLPHPGKGLGDLRFDREGRRLFISSFTSQGMAFDRPPLESRLAEVVNVASGRGAFPALDSMLEDATFSPDDHWLAVARTNHVIELLDTESGRVVAELKGHTNEITMLAFSADTGLLASSSLDHTVRIWRVPGGQPVGKPVWHDMPVLRVVWSADGRFIASASGEDAPRTFLQVWDAATHQRLGVPMPQFQYTRALFFNPSGETRLFTCGEGEGTFCVWKVGSETSPEHTFGKCGDVRCWECSPDGTQLALGMDGGGGSVWSVGTWRSVFPSEPFSHSDYAEPVHSGYVESVHFSPDGTRLLTTSDDGTAKLWSLQRKAETARLTLSTNLNDAPAEQKQNADLRARVSSVQHPRRGHIPGPIPTPLADKTLHMIDPGRLTDIASLRPLGTEAQTTTNLLMHIPGHTGARWALWEGSTGNESAKQLTIWTLQDGTFRPSVFAPPEGILGVGVQFSADDSQIAVVGNDGVIRICRTTDGRVERTVRRPDEFEIFPNNVLAEPFDPGLQRLLGATGQRDTGVLHLLDLTTRQFTTAALPLTSITRMRLSPDGTRLAFIARQSGRIFDLIQARLVTPPFKQVGDLYDVEWSQDGKQVLTVGFGVKLWSASTGEMLGAPMSGLAAAHWSADGRFIVTREEREDSDWVRVYDAATTEPVTPSLHHAGYVRWVCITRENRLITASDPNLLRAWDLKPTTLDPNVVADYAKFLSGRRLSAGGVLLPIPGRELVDLERSLRARAPELFE
jgi:WD40 repeat protein